MKKFYISAWFLLTAAILVTGLAGAFSPTILFVLSLAGLSLIYALALWSAIINTRELETK